MSAISDIETDQIHKWNRILQYAVSREKKQFDLVSQVYKSFFSSKPVEEVSISNFLLRK